MVLCVGVICLGFGGYLVARVLCRCGCRWVWCLWFCLCWLRCSLRCLCFTGLGCFRVVLDVGLLAGCSGSVCLSVGGC